MSDNLGIASGLLGSQMSGRDTTNIPPAILGLMKKRALEKKDDTPVWSQQDALKAINEKYKGMDDKTRDSIAKTFDHSAYVKHLDEIGMQVVPKPKQ